MPQYRILWDQIKHPSRKLTSMTTERTQRLLAQRREMLPFTKTVYLALQLCAEVLEVNPYPPKRMPFIEVYAPAGKFKVHVFPQRNYGPASARRANHDDFVCIRFSFYDPKYNRDRTIEVHKDLFNQPIAVAQKVMVAFLSEVLAVRQRQVATKATVSAG